MKWLKDFFRVWRRECWLVFTDVGVMLFFFALPLGYPIVYTLIYNPEVVKEIDTVIVDHSRTAESRELARTLDATQSIHITGYAADMAEARRAWAEKDCYAIIEIPSDYARQIGSGGQGVISYYQDMSLLLRYRQILLSLTSVQMHEAQTITAKRVATMGGGLATVVSGLPVNTQANSIGDSSQGFASFIIPGIVILILQQGMLMGIMMLAGTRRDRRRRDPERIDRSETGAGPLATILGRSACYVMLYIPMAYYVMAIVPAIFDLPQMGDVADYIPFILVMLLATSFLGQTLQIFVRERETSMVLIVFTSVFFLFLSGLTWPRYAFSPFWMAVSNLIPATWGVEGFIRIKANASTLPDISRYFWALWILTGAYFVTALLIRIFTAPSRKEVTQSPRPVRGAET